LSVSSKRLDLRFAPSSPLIGVSGSPTEELLGCYSRGAGISIIHAVTQLAQERGQHQEDCCPYHLRSTVAELSLRAVLFVIIILFSPIAILMPFWNSAPAASTTYVVVQRTAIATYTSTAFDTSMVSTVTTATSHTPVSIPSQGLGFIASKGKCSQFMMPITVKSGITLSLDVSSTNPANLYLLPSETYLASPNGCGLVEGSPLVAKNNFTTYTLRWTASENCTVYLLLTGPSTVIILMNHGSAQAVQQIATATYVSTETNLSLYSSVKIADYTTSTTILTPSLYYLSLQRIDLSLLACIIACSTLLILGSKRAFLVFGRLKKVFKVAGKRSLA